MSGKTHKRSIRNFLISPTHQLRHAIFFSVSILFGMSLMGLLLFDRLNELLPLLHHQGVGKEVLLQVREEIVTYFIFLAFLISAVYGVINIVWTHKIFGSMYAMEKFVENALNDNFDRPLTSRKGDQTKKLVELLSQLVAKYKEKASSKS